MNTSFHLAEYRSDLDLDVETCASAVLVVGGREWVEWEDIDYTDEDFPTCGTGFESEHPAAFDNGPVGTNETKLLAQRPLVDFAVKWFESNRQ